MRSNGKRLLAAASIAILVPALAACSAGSGSGNLSIWHELAGSGDEAVNQLIEGFNSENPDTTFSARQIADGEVNTVIRTGLSGNNPPALLQYEGYKQTEDYAKAGQLTDITEWWNDNKDAFSFADNQVVKDACEVDGKMYCIPWDLYSSNQLFYNPELLEQYGLTVPEKLSDLVDDAKKLEGTGISTVSLYSGEGWTGAQWWSLLAIERCGVDTVLQAAKQDGATWDQECFLQASEDLASLAEGGVFPEGVAGSDYNSQMSLFLSGKAVFMNTGTWFEQTLAESPASFEVGVTPFPQVDPSKPSKQLLGGINEVFGIPARLSDDKKDAAYSFLDYMAQKSSGELFAKASVMNMVEGANESLPEGLQVTWEQAQAALDAPGSNIVTYFENLVAPSVGEDAIYNGATGLAAGTITPQDFVTKLQTDAAAAIASGQ